jgi:hypothetical protein
VRTPVGAHVVVVRVVKGVGKTGALKLALLTSYDMIAQTCGVRYALARHSWHPKTATVLDTAVLRDATPRERELGHVIDPVPGRAA